MTITTAARREAVTENYNNVHLLPVDRHICVLWRGVVQALSQRCSSAVLLIRYIRARRADTSSVAVERLCRSVPLRQLLSSLLSGT